jgi:hypothetical protein
LCLAKTNIAPHAPSLAVNQELVSPKLTELHELKSVFLNCGRERVTGRLALWLGGGKKKRPSRQQGGDPKNEQTKTCELSEHDG